MSGMGGEGGGEEVPESQKRDPQVFSDASENWRFLFYSHD